MPTDTSSPTLPTEPTETMLLSDTKKSSKESNTLKPSDVSVDVLQARKGSLSKRMDTLQNESSPAPKNGACGSDGKNWDCTNWDLNTQQPHGGQEWSTMGGDFKEDFSVTTNFMGPPWKAVTAAASSLQYYLSFGIFLFFGVRPVFTLSTTTN